MNKRNFIKNLVFGTMVMGIAPRAFSSVTNEYDEEKCRQVWKQLCGSFAEREGFEYVIPEKNRPKILLYGDSISMGYTPTVRNEMKGKADVFRIFRNGGASTDFIPSMEKMRKTMFQPYMEGGWDFKWDVIHFNVGLHDLKYIADGKLDKINGKQVTSVSRYKKNIGEICGYLIKTYPDTQLIFATTTPVPEGEPGRVAGDAVRYNEAAMEVLASYPDIIINDLYAFTKPMFEKWAIKPANVHFNETGKTEQGKHVAKIVWTGIHK